MMSSQAFDSADRDLILCEVSGLPPVSWLAKYRTPDQVEHWNGVRWHFQLLHAELKSFFHGVERPVYPSPELDFFFQKETDKYVALYSLLRADWRTIRNIATVLEVTLPVTCGEALVQILEQDCRAALGEAEKYAEIRPRKMHELLRKRQKVEALKKKPNPTPEDLEEIQEVESATKVISPHMQGRAKIRGFCLAVCIASCNPSVKQKLKEYQRHVAEVEGSALYHFHPRKKVRGYTWSNGTKKSP